MIRRPPRSTPLSLHDALPIYDTNRCNATQFNIHICISASPLTIYPSYIHAYTVYIDKHIIIDIRNPRRSEEHTSELQSPCNLVCRLLLEKKTRLYSRHSQLSTRSRSFPSSTLFFFNDTATTEIYTSFPTRRSSDL